MRTSLKHRLNKAFTLIELLIVITIVGILAVALVPRISQGPAKARDLGRKADLHNIEAAMEFYFSDNGHYPATSGCVIPNDPSTTVGVIGPILENYVQNEDVPTGPNTTEKTFGCDNEYYYYLSLNEAASGNDDLHYAVFTDLEVDGASSEGHYCFATDPTDPATITATTYDDFVLDRDASCPATFSYYTVSR